MDKPPVNQRFVPAKGSITSDAQFGTGSSTAKMDNLAAIMKNSIVVFESPVTFATIIAEKAIEEDAEQANG